MVTGSERCVSAGRASLRKHHRRGALSDEDTPIPRMRTGQVHSDHPLLLLLSTNLGVVRETSSETRRDALVVRFLDEQV